MKTILKLTVFLSIVVYILAGFSTCNDFVTKADLSAAEQRLKDQIVLNRNHIIIVERKIDSLQQDVQVLGINQDTIKAQIYQLQNGQIVIYQAVQNIPQNRDAKQRFLSNLARLLNLN